MQKLQLSFRQIINFNLGFLGLQFGWALQWVNMSGIYKFLGVDIAHMAYLWIVAPLSGLIIQPIISQLGDQTRFNLYRYRPYILSGAILASIALIFIPNSTSIIMATFLLLLLDSSLNMAMQSCHEFSPTLTNENQFTKYFVIQTCLVGVGATLASALPWIFLHVFNLRSIELEQNIPLSIRLSFYAGSAVLLLTNLWAIITTKENFFTKDSLSRLNTAQKISPYIFLANTVKQTFTDLFHMPKIMREISYVQFFSWLGMFCVYLYFGLGVAQNIFGLPTTADVSTNANHYKMLENGIALGCLCFGIYILVSVGYAFLIPYITKLITRKGTHMLLLTLGALGLLSANLASNAHQLFWCMLAFGAAWASITTTPYAILARHLPKEKMGLYMGLFNFTICIPQIVASLTLSSIVKFAFHYHAMPVVQLAGVFLLCAAFFTLFVHDQKDPAQKKE